MPHDDGPDNKGSSRASKTQSSATKLTPTKSSATKATGRVHGSQVSDLARHIAELDAEVGHLRKAARREIEERWALHHTELFPRFLQWKEGLGLTHFAVYSHDGKTLSLETLMSSPGAPGLSGPLDVRQGRAELEAAWGAQAGDLLAFALASRDLQVDFRTGVLCIPIVFFDSVTGVVFARLQVSDPKTYPRILAETNALLTHVREVSVESHAPALVVRSAS